MIFKGNNIYPETDGKPFLYAENSSILIDETNQLYYNNGKEITNLTTDNFKLKNCQATIIPTSIKYNKIKIATTPESVNNSGEINEYISAVSRINQ